jgi:hypothetical protein
MKRILVFMTLVLALLALAATGLADPGGKGKSKKVNRFTYSVVVTDNGSCGTPWATDTSRRTWKVRSKRNGTFVVTRKDKGTFTTLGGESPGKCDPKGTHGTTVAPGVHGKFRGYLTGKVTGGTYNPNAACNAACGGSTNSFIAAFFGPSATFTCLQGYAGCKFNFEYSSPDKTLRYRHWQDQGTNGVSEQFIGDIATS